MVLLICLIVVHYEYLYFIRVGYLNIQILLKYIMIICKQKEYIYYQLYVKSDP